jgi:hypothetical protein
MLSYNVSEQHRFYWIRSLSNLISRPRRSEVPWLITAARSNTVIYLINSLTFLIDGVLHGQSPTP